MTEDEKRKEPDDADPGAGTSLDAESLRILKESMEKRRDLYKRLAEL